MVDLRAVSGVLGSLIAALGVTLLVTAGVGLFMEGEAYVGFLITSVVALGGGALLWHYFRPEAELRIREGFTIVAGAWFTLSVIGAFPFVLEGIFDNYTDAFFETMSGFTTTGATVLGGAYTPAISELPASFLFWRSLTQWLGGMGIIVLTLAILPLLGVGGMQLYRAEVSGPATDKLTPRVRETAKRLWLIYIGFTGIQIALLAPAIGMFEAVNHSFTTMATGGYSTRDGSIGEFDSAYVDWVIISFMFIAGISFALHYRLFRGGPRGVLLSRELRLYCSIAAVGTVLVFLAIFAPTGALLWIDDRGLSEEFSPYAGALDALRYAAFQVVSIMTTTGYGTDDYAVWPPLALGVIFLLFFVGGMAGSTGGGIKVIRHLILFKSSMREMKQLIHPNAVIPIRLHDRVVPPDVIQNVLAFIVLYFGLIVVGTLIMSFVGLDLLSAFGAAISSMGNVGPGFGSVGPAENYAHVPAGGKWVLALLMMAGRLEIFTVMVLVAPAFWRK